MNVRHSRDLLAAFSLIEIIIALGIISFALVGILGLIPVAIDSSVESQRETQATLIARKIFSDLDGKKPFVQKDASNQTEQVNFSTDQTYDVSYNESGLLLGDTSPNAAPASNSSVYSAKIAILANKPSPKLTSIKVTVFTPTNAPVQNQKTYTFVTLKGIP